MIIINMSQLSNSMSDVLRKAIIDSGVSLVRFERETGVQRASISRFVRGQNSLRLDLADKLAEYLGLKLRAQRKGKKAR